MRTLITGEQCNGNEAFASKVQSFPRHN